MVFFLSQIFSFDNTRVAREGSPHGCFFLSTAFMSVIICSNPNCQVETKWLQWPRLMQLRELSLYLTYHHSHPLFRHAAKVSSVARCLSQFCFRCYFLSNIPVPSKKNKKTTQTREGSLKSATTREVTLNLLCDWGASSTFIRAAFQATGRVTGAYGGQTTV